MSIQAMNTQSKRHYADRSQHQSSMKSIADRLSSINQLSEKQLEQLNIDPNGEFHRCSNTKTAVDVVNHIKGPLRLMGFGCYALHNYVWIVPFVHQNVHLPDFERAKTTLPNLKQELIGDVSSIEFTAVKKRSALGTLQSAVIWVGAITVGILLLHLFG